MPTPTIPAGNLFMNATLWTGDNTNPRSITNGAAGQSFQPDLVWVKARNSGQFHVLNDSVRGAGTALGLSSQATNAEGNADIGLYGATTAFNSNGFNVGGGSSNQAFVNLSGVTYVGWQWKAGGTAVTNTSGTISSQVSANTTSGFSIVRYTIGASGGGTVGHGLGVAPKFIINKVYDRTENWRCYNENLGNTKAIYLNTTAASTTDSVWGNTSPTSSVFTIGTGYFSSGDDCIAYCWSEIAGYSAFGSYTGNGSTDGPFIYTGFRPAFILVKRTDSTGNWCLFDNKRLGYNGASASKELYPNLSTTEGTSNGPDQLSNGFKFRDTYADVNASGATYIYAAFAENPFKYANAR